MNTRPVNIRNINQVAANHGLRLSKGVACFSWVPATADRTIFSLETTSVLITKITDLSWYLWMGELSEIVGRINRRKAEREIN